MIDDNTMIMPPSRAIAVVENLWMSSRTKCEWMDHFTCTLVDVLETQFGFGFSKALEKSAKQSVHLRGLSHPSIAECHFSS